MQEAEKLSLEEIRRFVEASEAIQFAGKNREQVYGWIERVLCQQQYARQGRAARGLLRRYIEKMTGMSRAQVTRLIGRYLASGRNRGQSIADTGLPSATLRPTLRCWRVDDAHQTLSGPATRRILEREYQQYDKPEYARLASISVSHLYNLRRKPRLSSTPLQLRQDQAHDGDHCRAPAPRPARPARLSAHRHRASGRSGRGQRAVSHQCRR